MRNEAKKLKSLGVFMGFVYLAMQAVTLPAYGEQIIGWGNQKNA